MPLASPSALSKTQNYKFKWGLWPCTIHQLRPWVPNTVGALISNNVFDWNGPSGGGVALISQKPVGTHVTSTKSTCGIERLFRHADESSLILRFQQEAKQYVRAPWRRDESVDRSIPVRYAFFAGQEQIISRLVPSGSIFDLCA